MKIEREWYTVRHNHYQDEQFGKEFNYTIFGRHRTIEEAREAIDERNQNNIEKMGIDAQFMITKTTYYLERDRHGMFLGSMTKEEFVELRDGDDIKGEKK